MKYLGYLGMLRVMLSACRSVQPHTSVVFASSLICFEPHLATHGLS